MYQQPWGVSYRWVVRMAAGNGDNVACCFLDLSQKDSVIVWIAKML